MARLIASGTVRTLRIGQSAAKLLRAGPPMEKVQRLSGSGPKHGLRYSPSHPRGCSEMKGPTSPELREPAAVRSVGVDASSWFPPKFPPG
jgi:hypothetical protein